MKFEHECSVGGYYSIYKNGELVAEHSNLITDAGWAALFTDNLTANRVCQVGTSNTPPTVADISLGGLLASSPAVTSGSRFSGTDTLGTFQGLPYVFAFSQGSVIGNIAEVGVRIGTSGGTLLSRALIKDGAGNPTVLTLTAIDQLTINYQVRVYLNTGTLGSTVINVAGTPTTCTLLDSGVPPSTAAINGAFFPKSALTHTYQASSVLGAAGTIPSGATSSFGQVLTAVTTSPGVATFTANWGISQGNESGGIGAMRFTIATVNSFNGSTINQAAHIGYDLKIGFSPAINKTNTKTLAVTVQINYTRL